MSGGWREQFYKGEFSIQRKDGKTPRKKRDKLPETPRQRIERMEDAHRLKRELEKDL